ncbi:hypothetical protein PTSG_01627 [Salpingoeca rosetta]|uniref:Eukaryotic translation initiation factor 2A n=1 Tax=Salpingoeca rosetta (strain ATCC 50818 / BSB-021) TaxID=946362 RepID=F2TYH5_SALR5|nr:uncharacterized protein PTSG_01627 [Salpingoeca rosetta]EGD78649.1 hypothetical protein PTSG_01627 [Salpingoeca rosetta]|eukprot:XP_004997607.1 hypothetical protein PTSG_01627 [Salpingoeca rosetta]
MADTPTTAFAVRSRDGLVLWSGPPGDIVPTNRIQEPAACRALVFSKAGDKVAWCNGREVVVLNLETNERECTIARPKTSAIAFSPKATHLCTWETFTTKDGQANRNCGVWALPSGEEVMTYSHKQRSNWLPKWTDDESVCVRQTPNTLLFFDGANITAAPTQKLKLEGLTAFEVAPRLPHCRVAVWIRGKKGMPSAVRVYSPTNLNAPIAYKSFFKADTVSMNWSNKGSEVLVSTQTDSDSSGASYYGETALYFLTCHDGTSANVTLDKKGPIAGCEWSPNGRHFVAMYGTMPNKASVFNYKCKRVQDLGTGHRSMARFNPHGSVLALCGFGNLGGEVEIWDTDKWEKINRFVAFNTTTFEWCADSRHILMATTTPRSTVDNCFKVWHYTKGEVKKQEYGELYEVAWQPMSWKAFPRRPLSPVPQEVKEAASAPKAEPYRPPGMRNRVVGMQPVVVPPGGGDADKKKKKNKKKKSKKKKPEPEQEKSAAEKPPSERTEEETKEVLKRARALKKKLRQIDALKQQQDEGETLNQEQLDKLASAAALEEELESLKIEDDSK